MSDPVISDILFKLELLVTDVESLGIIIDDLREDVEKCRQKPMSLFTRIIIAFTVASSLSMLTWVGETLYNIPSPNQQYILKLERNQVCVRNK